MLEHRRYALDLFCRSGQSPRGFAAIGDDRADFARDGFRLAGLPPEMRRHRASGIE
jgi:hypothetical protein